MSKLSKRTRRLTRHINSDLPYGRWPENHNRQVQLRKRTRNLKRQFRALTLAAGRASRAIEAFASAFAAFPTREVSDEQR